MSREFAVGKSSAAASSYTETSEPTVGKQTLTEQHAPAPARLAQVKARAGATVVDAAGFTYVVTSDGAFEITFAPPPWERSLGAVITMTGKYSGAWNTLADLLGTTNDDQQCVEPAPKEEMSIGQPAPPEDMSIGQPAPSPSAPADVSGVWWVSTNSCKLRKQTGEAVKPEKILTQHMHVRVLETQQKSGWTNARIATVDPAGGAGEELGWASLAHMFPLSRAPRPSTAAAQMAAVLSAARSVAGKQPGGICYTVFKQHIINGGGYGDLLDLKMDERFVGLTLHATMFHTAVQNAGAAALGLEAVGGLPMHAPAGTILVLRGNGKAKISMESGDVSFIDGVKGNVVVCYNDGQMNLVADEKAWGPGGHMEGTLVAMYKPIDRA